MTDSFKKENSKNIILSPHLDDAVISLGGFIYNNSLNISIVTIFTGKPKTNKITSWNLQSGFINSSKALDARISENKKALSYLGVLEENIINLNFLDKQYLSQKQQIIYQKELVKKILISLNGLINENTKNIDINLFAPISNINIDHKIAYDFILYFRDNYSDKYPKVKLFLYEDYPYFLKFKKTKKYNNEFLNKKIIMPLTLNELKMKINAIKLYHSQFRIPLTDLNRLLTRFKNNKKDNFNKEVIYKLD